MKNFVFISGVSTGIGNALLHQFLKKGYHVIGTVRQPVDAEKLLSQYTDGLTVLQFDVRDREKMESEISRVAPMIENGNMAALINNAGYAVPGPLELLDEKKFRDQFDVNVLSVRRITNALLPFLKEKQPGKIINISSVSGIFNTPFLGAYCVSKHALESLNEVYRRELAMFGIDVISILPGPIKTEIWKKNIGVMAPYLDSPYGPLLKNADLLIEKSNQNGLPVDAVVEVVWKAFTARKPKARYIIHQNPWRIRIFTSLIPAKWMDRLILKTMASGKKIRPV